MSISDDDLRAALRNYAETAGPAGFGAEPVIRRAGRRRARFAAAGAGCALAVVVAAVVVASAGAAGVPTPASYVPPIPVGPAGSGPWPTSFGCGQPLPSDLPGSAGFALRISVGRITRTASGRPAVAWNVAGTETPHHAGPEPGPTQALALVVRSDGTIIAVMPAPGPSISHASYPMVERVVPPSEIARAEPRIVACQPTDWSRVWAHHQRYGVVVLTTAWVGYPGADPARFGAAAALPSG